MTALAQYNAARAAIATAVRIDEAVVIRDEMEHVKLYAKQAKDKELLADAADIQLRAERRLGELLIAAESAGHLQKKGRPRSEAPPEKCSGVEHFPPATLDEIGVDRKTSAKIKKVASIAERAFEAMVQATRQRIVAGRAIIISAEPVNAARAIAPGRQEPDDSLDYFPTPPWATRALIERVMPHLGVREIERAWEPASGEGHIAEVLREYCDAVAASDVFDYGYGRVADFLTAERSYEEPGWIITNPPFGDKAIQFVLRALRLAPNVAMFFRSQWAVEGVERYESIFRDRPPTLCAFCRAREPLQGTLGPGRRHADRLLLAILDAGAGPLPPFWIPPGCRATLSRPDDAERFTARPVIKREGGAIAQIPVIEDWNATNVRARFMREQQSESEVMPADKDSNDARPLTPPHRPEAAAAADGAIPSIGEPVDSWALIRGGEAEPASDPGLSAGSPIDDELELPNFLRRGADNSAPWMDAVSQASPDASLPKEAGEQPAECAEAGP